MSSEVMERLLARLLTVGTWLASCVILAGLGMAFWTPRGMSIANAGIGLLILLPVSRLFLMLFVFLRGRDYRLAAASGLVLLTILAGVIVGVRLAISPEH